MDDLFTVVLPDIGEGVVEGEVISWLKKEGDSLSQDEPVVIVMTDKATVELPAPYPGKLVKQYFQPGEKAIKDLPLYDILLDEPEKVTRKKHAKECPMTMTAHKEKGLKREKERTSSPPFTDESKGLAIPPMRKLAKELGVSLSTIQGTGKDGRITIEDLRRTTLAEKSKSEIPSFPGDRKEPLIGIRQLMAKKMVESKREIPHFSYFEQLDATRLVRLRERIKEEAAKEGIGVTYMPFIIRALSLALKQFPLINSSYDPIENQIIYHAQQHVGIAVTTPLGLVVPVLKNVEEMNLPAIIRAYHDLREKFQQQKLQSSDMKGSTITISNFGVLSGGGLWATPIINHPESAILAISKIQPQPIVKNGSVVVKDLLNLSWSFDHRIIDGELAASFSHAVCSLLQNPAMLSD